MFSALQRQQQQLNIQSRNQQFQQNPLYFSQMQQWQQDTNLPFQNIQSNFTPQNNSFQQNQSGGNLNQQQFNNFKQNQGMLNQSPMSTSNMPQNTMNMNQSPMNTSNLPQNGMNMNQGATSANLSPPSQNNTPQTNHGVPQGAGVNSNMGNQSQNQLQGTGNLQQVNSNMGNQGQNQLQGNVQQANMGNQGQNQLQGNGNLQQANMGNQGQNQLQAGQLTPQTQNALPSNTNNINSMLQSMGGQVNPQLLQQMMQMQNQLNANMVPGQMNTPQMLQMQQLNAQKLMTQQLTQQNLMNASLNGQQSMNQKPMNDQAKNQNVNMQQSGQGLTPQQQQLLNNQNMQQQIQAGMPNWQQNQFNTGMMGVNNITNVPSPTTRQNSFKTFEGTPHANLNERSVFEATFHQFLQKRNTNAGRIPPLGQKPMDAFVTFHTIVQEGGFDKLRISNNWFNVCMKLGIEISPKVITQLQTNYVTFLYPLEQMILQSGARKTPQPQQQMQPRPQQIGNTKMMTNDMNSMGSPSVESLSSQFQGNVMQNPMQPQMMPQVQKSQPATPVQQELPPEPIPNVIIEEDGEGVEYVPKARRLTSFGGLDLGIMSDALKKMRASKELYAPKNLKRLNMALKSGLTYQIRYGLDVLTIYSSEFQFRIQEYPPILDTLVILMKSTLAKLEMKPNQKFLTYRELFEIESTIQTSFQANYESSLDENKWLMEQTCAIGLILRNATLLPDNQFTMSKNVNFITIIFQTLNLPISSELESLTNPYGSLPITLPTTNVLEHRKNSLIMLSNIANYVILPNQEMANLIVQVCTDYISETDNYYVNPALDVLGKLLTIHENQVLIGNSIHVQELCTIIFSQLPTQGFSFDATPHLLTQWELMMMILSTIVSVLSNLDKQELSKKQYIQQLKFLASRPKYQTTYPPALELQQQFASIRERAFRTFIELGKDSIEEDMVRFLFLASKNGDIWMVTIILEYLSKFSQ
ncbi:hypothetical protein BC833DRAFT_598498 [Globomyces pollinis-pini]|nr:hypothetical protein BC833DRAFT_598498 [Globomyces pollinis-pini]